MTDPFRQANTTPSPISNPPLQGTDLQKGIDNIFDPLGAGAAERLQSSETPLQASTDSFTKWANETGAPTGEDAKAAQDGGQSTLANVEAKPCADCKTDADYSLAFQVKDAKGKLCKSMYYTLKFEVSKRAPITGSTDDNGLTVRYFTDDSTEVVYLYIGKRTDEDGYPKSQTTQEEIYDEAPLGHAAVAPTAEKKIEPCATKRLWKPWKVSDEGRAWLKKEEGYKNVPYNDHLGYATIGIGHLLHKSGVTEDDKKQYPAPVTTEETKAREDLLQGYFESDVRADDRAGGDRMESIICVPLYVREYDALIDQGFQFGGGTVTNQSSSFRKWLNRGRYTKTANVFSLFVNSTDSSGNKVYDEKVAKRSARNKDTFLNGTYKGPGE